MQTWIGNGNIAADLKLLGQNGKLATTAIAVDRGMKDANGNWVTDFLNLRFLGDKQVARAQKELQKGIHAVVQGKVCHETYTDRNGEKRYADYIMVSQFQVPHTRNANAEDGGIAPAAEESPAPAQKTEEFINIPDTVSDDGMPFN